MWNILPDIGNLVSVVGSGLFVLGGFGVIFKYVVPSLSQVVIEAGLYTIGAALARNSAWQGSLLDLTPQSSFLLSLPGQLGLPATVAFSLSSRNITFDTTFGPFMALCAFWGWQAISYQSQLLGAGSIMALLGAFGAEYGAMPHCLYFGVNRQYTAALNHLTFVLALAYGYLQVTGKGDDPMVYPFKAGIYIGGLVTHYLTHLILSERWYSNTTGSYVLSNIWAVTALLLGYGLGGQYNLHYVQNVAVTMGFLYGIEKYFEVVCDHIYPAMTILGALMAFGPIAWREYMFNHVSQTLSYLN